MKIETARFVLAAHEQTDFLCDGRPEIALVGRSNVGKSSLLNRLVGRARLARISSSPGRTRAVNYFLINERFYLVDLPGYGFAKVSKREREGWARLMDAYFRRDEAAVSVIQLVDAKVGATPLDVPTAIGSTGGGREYLAALAVPATVVATKIDRLRRGRRKATLDGIRAELDLGETQLVPFSARTGEGTKDVWRAIGARLTTHSAPAGQSH